MKLNIFKKKTDDKDTELLSFDPHCLNCDTDIIPDGKTMIKFCPDCGTELIQPFRCAVCNTPVNATSKYCTGCGMLAIR